jgi:hypothetical protein
MDEVYDMLSTEMRALAKLDTIGQVVVGPGLRRRPSDGEVAWPLRTAEMPPRTRQEPSSSGRK